MIKFNIIFLKNESHNDKMQIEKKNNNNNK